MCKSHDISLNKSDKLTPLHINNHDLYSANLWSSCFEKKKTWVKIKSQREKIELTQKWSSSSQTKKLSASSLRTKIWWRHTVIRLFYRYMDRDKYNNAEFRINIHASTNSNLFSSTWIPKSIYKRRDDKNLKLPRPKFDTTFLLN